MVKIAVLHSSLATYAEELHVLHLKIHSLTENQVDIISITVKFRFSMTVLLVFRTLPLYINARRPTTGNSLFIQFIIFLSQVYKNYLVLTYLEHNDSDYAFDSIHRALINRSGVINHDHIVN